MSQGGSCWFMRDRTRDNIATGPGQDDRQDSGLLGGGGGGALDSLHRKSRLKKQERIHQLPTLAGRWGCRGNHPSRRKRKMQKLSGEENNGKIERQLEVGHGIEPIGRRGRRAMAIHWMILITSVMSMNHDETCRNMGTSCGVLLWIDLPCKKSPTHSSMGILPIKHWTGGWSLRLAGLGQDAPATLFGNPLIAEDRLQCEVDSLSPCLAPPMFNSSHPCACVPSTAQALPRTIFQAYAGRGIHP